MKQKQGLKYFGIPILFFLCGCVHSLSYRYVSGSVMSSETGNESGVSVVYDSLQIGRIKSGYYFKKITSGNSDVKTDTLEWISISKDNQVKIFKTPHDEFGHLFGFNSSSNEPYELYKALKKNNMEFEKAYLKCNNNVPFVPSVLKMERIIILYPKEGAIFDADELLFVKGGLIRKLRDYDKVLSMDKYIFIGK